jgi:hypothetical protein
MQNIIKENLARNGNGAAGAINARGISHRGWTDEERVARAADAVLGETHVVPSIGQAATAFFVSPARIREELKTRAKAQAAVEPTNGATVEATGFATNGAAAEVISTTTAMPDTPEVRVSLRRLAASLGCKIELLDEAPQKGLDYGPYVLRYAGCGHDVWPGGLPIEGIVDALMCLMHERQLPEDRIGEAWANFGSNWQA